MQSLLIPLGNHLPTFCLYGSIYSGHFIINGIIQQVVFVSWLLSLSMRLQHIPVFHSFFKQLINLSLDEQDVHCRNGISKNIHHLDGPQFVNPFIHSSLQLLPPFGYGESPCYPHQCTGTCSRPCFKFFWVYRLMKLLGHVGILCLTSEEL